MDATSPQFPPAQCVSTNVHPLLWRLAPQPPSSSQASGPLSPGPSYLRSHVAAESELTYWVTTPAEKRRHSEVLRQRPQPPSSSTAEWLPVLLRAQRAPPGAAGPAWVWANALGGAGPPPSVWKQLGPSGSAPGLLNRKLNFTAFFYYFFFFFR